MGFSLTHHDDPNYWYTEDFYNRRHRWGFRKSELEKKFGPLLEGETEWAAMQRFGYDRVWDCGTSVWVWVASPP